MREQHVSLGGAGIELPHDTVVTMVPDGRRTTLPAGSRVTPLQVLGGRATVTTAAGEMARLDHRDAAELGIVTPDHSGSTPSTSSGDKPFTSARVWEAASTVYDPEIPVDIVELGLVYRVDTRELPGHGWRVDIDMSVTAPFCGMGDILRADLHEVVAALPGVEQVSVQLVFDPVWDRSMMSEAARLELGWV